VSERSTEVKLQNACDVIVPSNSRILNAMLAAVKDGPTMLCLHNRWCRQNSYQRGKKCIKVMLKSHCEQTKLHGCHVRKVLVARRHVIVPASVHEMPWKGTVLPSSQNRHDGEIIENFGLTHHGCIIPGSQSAFADAFIGLEPAGKQI